MCGLCGIMRLGDASIDPTGGLIDRMTDCLTHRGPNDRGTWCTPDIALGHRRLSVIDLSEAGRQPMSNEDGSVQIVYNGEMYNFRELEATFGLRAGGHRPGALAYLAFCVGLNISRLNIGTKSKISSNQNHLRR